MSKPIVEISNWYFTEGSYFCPPDAQTQLVGFIKTHHRTSDGFASRVEQGGGMEVITSLVQSIDMEKMIVETKNTEYHLIGEPKQEYAEFLKKQKEI
jgi:hypothetical protein